MGPKAKSTKAIDDKPKGFTEEEKDAMRERIKELKDEGGEEAVLAKIAEMKGQDREMGERIHEIVRSHAPSLEPRLWYGMPAYAKDGKVVCFFQPAAKFKSRYSTLGFSDKANIDEGEMWPVVWALSRMTAAEESRIGALVKKAAS